MTREVPEWRGKTDDAAIPPRVRLRVLLAHDGRCAITGHKFVPGDVIEFDHKVALALGGEHRESNLQPLLGSAHKAKTAQDVATLAKDRRVRAKHLGIAPPSPRAFQTNRKGPRKAKVGGPTLWRDA